MKKLSAILLLFMLIFTGCTTDSDDGPDLENQYLVSYEKLTPEPISTGALGLLIKLAGDLAKNFDTNLLRYRVDIYKVVYKTTYKGQEIHASGACLIPRADNAVPMLSYQHGTIFENKDAPSEYKRISEATAEMWLNIVFASSGYICSMPDYIGYGESNHIMHPYLVADYTSSASIDMMRAVKELCTELDVARSNEHFLTGYSEGGYATLAVMKAIEAQHSSEFPLTAVSAGSGAYDISGTAENFMSKTVIDPPHFTCYVYLGHNEANSWGRELGTIFQSPYTEKIEAGLFMGDHSGSEIKRQLTVNRDELFNTEFVTAFNGSGEFDLKESLKKNSVHQGWVPKAPLKMFHGGADITVPSYNSQRAYDNFVAGGANSISLTIEPGLDHSGGIYIWVFGTLEWFETI